MKKLEQISKEKMKTDDWSNCLLQELEREVIKTYDLYHKIGGEFITDIHGRGLNPDYRILKDTSGYKLIVTKYDLDHDALKDQKKDASLIEKLALGTKEFIYEAGIHGVKLPSVEDVKTYEIGNASENKDMYSKEYYFQYKEYVGGLSKMLKVLETKISDEWKYSKKRADYIATR